MPRLFAHRFFKLLVVGCLLLMPLTSLQAQPLLTLEEAVQETLKNNKSLRQARNRRRIAAYDHHISKTDFFPTLTLPSMGASWPQSSTQRPPLNPSLHDGGQSTPSNPWFKNEVGLSWTFTPSSLFSYQTSHRKDQISELQWQQKEARKIEETIKAYYALVLAQQERKMEEDSLSIAEETLRLTQAQYEVGQKTELDYLDAQVTYERAHATFLKKKEAIASKKQAFCRLLGRDESAAFVTVEDIPLPEQLNWETLLAAYKLASPDLLLAQKQYESDITSLKLRQADRLFPTLGLGVDYTFGEQQPQYQVNLTFDLTTIFRLGVDLQKERLQAENHRLQLADQEIGEEERLRSQFLAYTQLLQGYALQQRSVQVSQARAAEALEKYRLGSSTLLELKKQQKEAQAATQQCLKMRYEMKEKEVALRALAGMPLGDY